MNEADSDEVKIPDSNKLSTPLETVK